MAFLLEAIAFAQLAFLPGALLLRASKLKFGPFGTPVACLALSGLANYLFVLLAVACGAFNHYTALGLVAAELALGAWLWRKELPQLLSSNALTAASGLARKAWKGIGSFIEEAGCPKAFAALALLAALIALLLATLDFINSAGTVFNAWDAVLSWNRWATNWLAGSYPEWTNGYPQLVPTNWALCYMVQGDSLQFVPKLSVGLYMLGVLLVFLDLGLLLRSAGLLAAAPLCAWLVHNVEIDKYGGDVDLAVTFMAFATFHCLIRASMAKDASSFMRLLIATSAMAAATAATKQVGLLIFVMTLPLAWLLLKKPMAAFNFDVKAKLKHTALHLLLAVLIASPCYICAKYMVMQGRDKYKVEYVTNSIYAGRGYAERAIISSKMLLLRLELGMHEIPGARWTHVDMKRGLDGFQDFYKPYRTLTAAIAIATLILLLYAALSSSLGLWPVALVALPLSIIWALLYCYDLRNLTSALPFFALGLGLGLEQLVARTAEKRLLWSGASIATALLAIILALGYGAFNQESLEKSHDALLRRIGYPTINAKLYEYHAKNPIRLKIATDYEIIDYLPGLKGSLHYQEFSGQQQPFYDLYLKAAANPAVGFMLVPNYTMKAVWDDIYSRLAAGTMEKVFFEDGFTLFKINRKPDEPPAKTDGKEQQ